MTAPDPPLATRNGDIEPFHVMDVLARARALEAQGRTIIHMEIGEPDFPTPTPVVEAGIQALKAGRTHYTPALGLPELRAAIAAAYPAGAQVDAGRVAVTPGASGALQLLLAALLNPGDEVLLADPGYPCHRHLVRLFEARAQPLPVGAETSYQLTAALIERHWTAATRAVMLASPSNPTGTLIPPPEMQRIVDCVHGHGGSLIVDEIYHGLTYGVEATSALVHAPAVFVINSFSKYYGMTGWRLGWLVAPHAYLPALDKLAQNLFLAPNTPAQYAALAALAPALAPELHRRRDLFQTRRDFLLPALRALGFDIPLTPQGAFYSYADCSRFGSDSRAFCTQLLQRAGVALTPGLDFGDHHAARHVRFSYANTLENLQEGVRRLVAYLTESSLVFFFRIIQNWTKKYTRSSLRY